MHQPIQNWFGGPMSALIYDGYDIVLEAVITKIEFRNDKAIVPDGVKVIELLHSKPNDTEEDFHARVTSFALSLK